MSADILNETSKAPVDVLQSIELAKTQEKQQEEEYYTNLKKQAIRAERERMLLQKKIYEVANPSPIFIAGLVIAVLISMYIVYVALLKPCLSGEWMDHAGNTWELNHNRFTGNFIVYINGVESGVGRSLDNYISYGDLVGVWNYGNVIVFTEGWQLNRVQ
jgi:hypothetical protein